MLKQLLARLRPSSPPPAAAASHSEPPQVIEALGVAPLDFVHTLQFEQGMPVPDWPAVQAWVDGIADEAERGRAWAEAEIAWLVHLRAALGAHYRLVRRGQAIVLSSLEGVAAVAAAHYIGATAERIVQVLDGVAQPAQGAGHDILIVLDDEESYYNYIARYYPAEGEFAFSGGVFLNSGCGHFVTRKADDLSQIEPTIAHELTHASLAHLPLPLWLNEGLAVNTEERLCPGREHRFSAKQRDHMHKAFWNAATIQEFWSGSSYARPDEGNLLSYDLGRLLVRHLAEDWPRFAAFANTAQGDDAGAAAAREWLSVDLGELVKTLFEVQAGQPSWSPQPALWQGMPA